VTPAGDSDLEDLQRSLGSLLRLHASRRVFAERAAAAGVVISQPGFALLSQADDGGAVTLGDLGRGTHMDPSAVGRQVRQLEEAGLLVRSTDPDDRRVTRVRATPRGRAVRRRLADAGRAHVAEALSEWSTHDRHELARLLAQLVHDLRAHRYPELSASGLSPSGLVEQESA
jgi:DNA-binding MarR family transcriptional regulator